MSLVANGKKKQAVNVSIKIFVREPNEQLLIVRREHNGQGVSIQNLDGRDFWHALQRSPFLNDMH